MADALRIVAIGAGARAVRHVYPCFSRLLHENAQVVACCDADEERLQAAAAGFGIRGAYTDYEAMIRAEHPDAAILCVDPAFHAEVSLGLMATGLHVFIVPPPAAEAEAAFDMQEVAHTVGRVCLVGFARRFAPVYLAAREVLRLPAFGPVCLMNIVCTSTPYPAGEDAPARYLLEAALPLLDLARFFGGEPISVRASFTAPANFAVAAHFDSGAVVSLGFSDRGSAGVPLEQVTVAGENAGLVRVDNLLRMSAWVGGEPVAGYEPDFVTGAADPLIERGYVGGLVEFVSAVRMEREPESSIASAAATLAFGEAVKEAALSGGTVGIELGQDQGPFGVQAALPESEAPPV